MTRPGTLREIRKNWQNYALMAPFLILFALFTLIPILYSVVISFTNFNIFTPPTFAGWDNYLRMFFDDDVFIIAIRNTMIFALVTGPFYAPVLSGTAFTVWSFIFSSDSYGLLNGWLMNLGILREPMGWLTDPNYILAVVIFVQLWMSLGTGFLSFIAGLQGVDRTLYEAGLVDGVHNRFQELWYITLPVMKPQLLFGAVMQIVSSFSVADVSIRLAGFPSTQYAAETLVTHIMDYGTVRFEMGYACALACFLFALMYAANKLVTFALGRVGR